HICLVHLPVSGSLAVDLWVYINRLSYVTENSCDFKQRQFVQLNDMDPSVPDTNFAPKYLIPCGVLGSIAFGLCVTRIYTRVRPVCLLTWADYLIAIAQTQILSLAGYLTAAGAAAHGWGHLSSYVSEHNRILAFKYVFATALLWVISIGLVRISVAFSLLQFSSSKIWKGILWTLITIQVMISTGLLMFMLFNCRPLRAFWEPVAHAQCWSRKYAMVFDWVSSVTVILIDFILALMPIQLIRILHRPLPEKILISCLMAMGLLATAIAAIKMTTFHGAFLGDPLSSTVMGSLWAKLEEQVGITAACIPCLKAPAERFLRRVGILATRLGQSAELPSFVVPKSRNFATLRVGSEEAMPDGDIGLVDSTKSAWTGNTVGVTSFDTAVESESRSAGTERTGSERWKSI
ncbi:hypothetical protein BKA61DRAFT_721895, partial [Leptodontidium sp. MPI-SDFR-AT-0119]